MSVGGKVVEVIDCGDSVWVNTREQVWDADLGAMRFRRCVAMGCHCSDCAIYVERTDKSLCIEPGDSLWWQSGWAMWTPRGGSRFGGHADIRIEKVSGSGVCRPDVKALLDTEAPK